MKAPFNMFGAASSVIKPAAVCWAGPSPCLTAQGVCRHQAVSDRPVTLHLVVALVIRCVCWYCEVCCCVGAAAECCCSPTVPCWAWRFGLQLVPTGYFSVREPPLVTNGQ